MARKKASVPAPAPIDVRFPVVHGQALLWHWLRSKIRHLAAAVNNKKDRKTKHAM
jgi:hypothetical protein